MTAPKVFISHAREDKGRFVLAFAEKLRNNGVDAWVDEWEILPGDRLVEKIFTEGIETSGVVVIVLSKISITKPWVCEELDKAVVERINRRCRILPVLIEECDVPAALTSTLYQEIDDINSYEEEFRKILASIFNHREKPPLGNPPAYVSGSPQLLDGFSKIDSTVFHLTYEYLFRDRDMSKDQIERLASGKGISLEDVNDAVDMLGKANLVRINKIFQGYLLNSTPIGMHKYLLQCRATYSSEAVAILSAIINKEYKNSSDYEEDASLERLVIKPVFDYLHHKGWVGINKIANGGFFIAKIDPGLKRMFENIGNPEEFVRSL